MINVRDLLRSPMAKAVPRVEVVYLSVLGCAYAGYLIARWTDHNDLTAFLYWSAMLIGFPVSYFAFGATYVMLFVLMGGAIDTLFALNMDAAPAGLLWVTGTAEWLFFMTCATVQAELTRRCLRRGRPPEAPAV